MAARLWRIASTVAGVVLAACGGGGGDGDGGGVPTSITEGAYGGSLGGSPVASDFRAIVLEGGEFWAIYGTQTSSAFIVSGMIGGGALNANSGSFTSTGVKDYYLANAGVNASLSGTYSATPAVSGTIAVSGASVTFSGGPISGSTYNYNTPASISAISGPWSVATTYGATATLTVTASGTGATFTATDTGGCTVAGNINVRPSGKNVFNIDGTYGSGCGSLAGLLVGGVAVAYPLSTGQTQLVATIVSAGAHTFGAAVIGVR